MLAALILGGALSVSGFLLQTFFSNPIAGPFVLGISSGAKLAVSIFMILFLGQGLIMNSWVMIGAAFLGAMASMGFVLAVSKASSDVHVSGKRDYDRIYLFGGNGFYRDLRR